MARRLALVLLLARFAGAAVPNRCRYVFATSTSVMGNITLGRADQLCMSLAVSAMLRTRGGGWSVACVRACVRA